MDENPIRILLIEDDEDDYILAEAALEDTLLSVSLDWVSSYQEGLADVQAFQHDIYLIDYNLGQGSGIDLVREVRQIDALIPMILLTGHHDRELDLEAMQSGAIDYLVKQELTPAMLERSIRYALKHTEALRDLQTFTQKLQARNAELDAFSHTVAHDIRSPLGVIMGYSDLLASEPIEFTEDQRGMVSTIQQYTRKLDDIIESLLLLSGLRNEAVQFETVNMNEVVDLVLQRLQHQISERGVQVTVHNPLPQAKGYAPWLEEMLANLIDNAIKYSGKDNLSPSIQIQGNLTHSGMVRFDIIDNGVGLKPEQHQQVLTKFARLHPGEAGGHGLGMSIIQRIIERHKGKLGVESVEGEGSTFWFVLPAV